MSYFRCVLILGVILGSVLTPFPVSAFDDAFPFGKRIMSRNFIITLALDIDEGALLSRLNIPSAHEILTGGAASGINYCSDDLADLVDALFGWVMESLEMPLHSFSGEIKVVAGIGQLNAVSRRLYGRDARSDKAFYVHDKNTIYIVAPFFTKEVLAHEMAHVTACHFYPAPLPERPQEVLAGYVEYELKRTSLRP